MWSTFVGTILKHIALGLSLSMLMVHFLDLLVGESPLTNAAQLLAQGARAQKGTRGRLILKSAPKLLLSTKSKHGISSGRYLAKILTNCCTLASNDGNASNPSWHL